MLTANLKIKKLSFIAAILASSLVLNGCVTALVAGGVAGTSAIIGSDSRNVSTQIDDQIIENRIIKILKNDATQSDRQSFYVDGISVNGNVLLVGQTVNTDYLLNYVIPQIKQLEGVRKIFNRVENTLPVSPSVHASDALITGKVKSALLLGSNISSGRFKVYTEDSVVYLLGFVTKDEGQRAINQASKVSGVKAIVPIYDYMPDFSSDAVSSSSESTSTAVSSNTTGAKNSSSMALETQDSVDNGGAVLEEDDDLLAPSAPANSF